MKSSQISVNSLSDIPAAVEYVERYALSAQHVSGAHACPLVCEEILLRLLKKGCSGISVAVKGRLFRHVEIRAAGARADADSGNPESEENEIGARISGCLLEQYSDYYVFQYQNGTNLYRVHTGSRDHFDLTDEIYEVYRDADPSKPRKPLNALWQIARRHGKIFSVSVLILLVKHLAALLLPVFVSNIINIVTDTGSFFNLPVLANILMAVAALSVNLICFWLDSRYYRRFTRAVEAGIRMALVQKLQVLSMRFHTASQSGVVLSKVVSDVQFIQMLIYDRFQELLYMGEDILFIIVISLMKLPLMLAFYAVIVPVAAYLLHRFMGPLQNRRAGMRQQNEQVGAAVKEMLEMEDLNRAHGLEKTGYRNILKKVRKAQQASVLYDRQTVSVNNITYGLFQGLRLLSLSFAALLTAAGHIGVGTLVLFQSIFEMIISNVQRMLDAVPMITQGYDSVKSVNEILCAEDVEQNGTEQLDSPVRGEIEFRHVSFGYRTDEEPVLKDISFRVPASGSIAFVGKSGQGKTTILNLILGLYSAWSGEILIDGKKLESLEKSAYRRNIAVVPQSTVLFSGTLWDNLVYGLSFVSADRVMNVIRSVGLEELVNSLPDGLNTRILEGGGNLSGGQRQRISIARALLREPKIILLDEATSALDSVSERQVQEAVDAMMGQCTVVMVAHRLSTLRHADVICRLDQGELEKYDSFEQVIRDMGGESGESPADT